MKKLALESKMAQRLAEVALFERIQQQFNLYPRAMAEKVCDLAARDDESWLEMRRRLRRLSIEEFELFFGGVTNLSRNKILVVKSNRTIYTREIREYFKLNERKFLKGFEGKVKIESLNEEMALFTFKMINMEVVFWAFNQVELILKDWS